MALADTLKTEVKEILKTSWVERDGRVIPEPEDVKLGNDAVKLTGVVLYADLAESTNLVRNYTAQFAAEVYKSYLHCATKIIRNNGGVITAFNGDRVMAVYIGDNKATGALRTALAINHAVQEIINPALKVQYKGTNYEVKQAVGIDLSELFIARTGIRGSNDLVWVGNAANHAAKLCGMRNGLYASWATREVYDIANVSVKVSMNNQQMWSASKWDGRDVYRSGWFWEQ